MKRFISLALTDLILLLLAFVLVHLANYGHVQISGTSFNVLLLQITAVLTISLAARKYTRLPGLSLIMGSGLVLKIGVGFLFLLSLLIVGLQLMHFSRTMAYGTLILFIFFELIALTAYQWLKGPVPHPGRLPLKSSGTKILRPLFILDGLLLLIAFFAVTYFKRDSFLLLHPYSDILLILLGLWLGFSIFTRKFNLDNFNDFLTAFGPALKTVLFMAAGLAFFIYLFRLEPVSRLQVFGPLPLLLVFEGFLFMLYTNYRRHALMQKDIEDPGEVQAILDRGGDKIPAEEPKLKINDPAGIKLRHALDFFDPRIFKMLDKHVNLNQIDRSECALLSTDNMFNLEALEEGRMSLIINLHKINDLLWFNRYFLLAHDKLKPGGYLVGMAHTITTKRDYYQNKYPRHLNTLFYSLSFIWGRVFPKLPGLNKLYFAVTGGRNRMLSRAEVLGRLCFCGYKIVAEEEIGFRFFFIAQKTAAPSTNPNPTYGPLVELKRTGLGGKPISVYKFRTMHPFSEYLQAYVYNLYGTKDGDKIVNDFRITGWGRIFRKLWIDELPMLYNWMRGDLKLVGVRPLSDHKLSIYPIELQEKRKKVKPGLLPPFYADRPTTVEGFFLAEEKYLDSYMKCPVRTDFRYFWIIVWNIVVRKARSG